MKDYFKKMYRFGGLMTVIKIATIAFILTIWVDVTNIPTKLLHQYEPMVLAVLVIGLIFLVAVFLKENNIQDFIKAKMVNELDSFILTSILYSTFYILVLSVTSLFKWYKIITLLSIILVLVIIFIIRVIKTMKTSRKENNTTANIFELKEFLDTETINYNKNYPILFAEKDVDYDLLERGYFIDKLYSSIMSCCGTDYSFVIGLEGSWGSGKTTIINNVIKRINDENSDKIIIIDDFDPWIYGSQEALLTALFESILRNTGIKYSKSSLKNLTNDLMESIFGSRIVSKTLWKTIIDSNSADPVRIIKDQIHDYLTQNNKTIVITIDNLDRASSNNIILLLKLISNVFDLDRIVYLLSYDKERINNILDKNLSINKNYIEKIIQQELKVSKLNKELFANIIRDVFKKLFTGFGVSFDNFNEYEFVFHFLADYCEDVRSLKRVINSIGFILQHENNLYKPDLLTLEIVRFFDNDLYEIIYNNPEYFVYTDQDTDANLFKAFFDRKKFNEKAQEFFNQLMVDYDISLLKLIANLFPYVDRALKSNEIRPEHDGLYDNLSKNISFNCRVASAKYFDLYFYYNENEYIKITQVYNRLLETIENEINRDDLESASDLFCVLFNEIPLYYHSEIINKLWFERDDLKQDLNYPVILGLIKSSNVIDSETGFFTLSAYQRSTAIIATIFTHLNSNEKDKVLDYLKNHYNCFKLCNDILYWLESSSLSSKNTELEAKKFEDLLFEMYDKIMNDPIDVFENENYRFHNLWSILRVKCRKQGLDENTDVNIVDYVSKIIKPEYIYKLLSDTIATSSGTRGYEYMIDSKNIKCFLEDETVIDNYLIRFPPKNDVEMFLYKVYELYKNGEPDDLGRKSFKCNHRINIRLDNEEYADTETE